MSIQIAPRTPASSSWPLVLLASTLVLFAFFTLTRPQTHWELDELLFRMGVENFEPLEHRPHPPGYPLLVGLGKLLAPATSNAFDALVVLALIATAGSFAAFAAAVARMTGSRGTGLAASTLFHLSPAMMIHGSTPMSDPPALMFASLALLTSSTGLAVGRAALTGAFAAAAIGCRPQYALAILPFLLWIVLRERTLDRIAWLLGAFTAVCLAWMAPLVIETGGVREMIDWQRAQAGYVAQNDAALARRGYSVPALVFRFIAHPWGSKVTAAPVLALAAIGGVVAVARRTWTLVPVAVLSGAHLLTTLAVYDPADGVRYALPGHLAVAAFAAVGLTYAAQRIGWRFLPPLALAAFLGAAWFYVEPVIDVRRTEPSPPVQAARWAREHLPADALILYDRSLAPHARVLFRDFEIRASDNPGDIGLQLNRPTLVLGEGANPDSNPTVFSWPDSDAYRKLTRNHYRVVSLTRVAAAVEPLAGVGTWESAGGPRWRWLADEARFDVGPGSPSGRMVLELPADAPHPETTVTIYAGDRRIETATAQRGATVTLPLRLPAEQFELRVVTSPSYAIPGDRRRFGIQLLDFDRAALALSSGSNP